MRCKETEFVKKGAAGYSFNVARHFRNSQSAQNPLDVVILKALQCVQFSGHKAPRFGLNKPVYIIQLSA